MTHVAARGAASGVNETLLLVLDAFIAMLQCILFSVMTAFGNKIVFIFLLYKRHYIHVLISICPIVNCDFREASVDVRVSRR